MPDQTHIRATGWPADNPVCAQLYYMGRKAEEFAASPEPNGIQRKWSEGNNSIETETHATNIPCPNSNSSLPLTQKSRSRRLAQRHRQPRHPNRLVHLGPSEQAQRVRNRHNNRPRRPLQRNPTNPRIPKHPTLRHPARRHLDHPLRLPAPVRRHVRRQTRGAGRAVQDAQARQHRGRAFAGAVGVSVGEGGCGCGGRCEVF